MTKLCPQCDQENLDNAFTCKHCQHPLGMIQEDEQSPMPQSTFVDKSTEKENHSKTKTLRKSANPLFQGIDWDALEESPSPQAKPESSDQTLSAPAVVNKVIDTPPLNGVKSEEQEMPKRVPASSSGAHRKFFSPSTLKVLAVISEAKQHPKIIAAIATFLMAAGVGGIILLHRQFSSPIVEKVALVPTPDGTFTFGGDPFYAALNPSGLSALLGQEYPEFELVYREPISNDENFEKSGVSGWAITNVLDKNLSFSTSSRPPSDGEINRAKARGDAIEYVPVAADATVFVTNSGVGISGLSVEQLQKIFKGEARNWKDFGGPDLPIKPMGIKVSSLAEMGLGGGQLGDNFEVAPSTTAMFRKILPTPGAIGFTSAALAEVTNRDAIAEGLINVLAVGAPDKPFVRPLTEDGGVHSQVIRDSSYPLTHSLFVVYRQGEEAGEAYVEILRSPNGRRILEEAGFVPVD